MTADEKEYRMNQETLELYPEWQQRRHIEAMDFLESKHLENNRFPEVVIDP